MAQAAVCARSVEGRKSLPVIRYNRAVAVTFQPKPEYEHERRLATNRNSPERWHSRSGLDRKINASSLFWRELLAGGRIKRRPNAGKRHPMAATSTNSAMRTIHPTPAGHQPGHPNEAAKDKCHHMIQGAWKPCEEVATHRQRGSGIPLCSRHALQLVRRDADVRLL